MFSNEILKQNKSLRILLYCAVIFFITLIAFSGSALAYSRYYQNKIFPGVRIGELELGGKSWDEAEILITEKINQINQNGIRMEKNETGFTVTPSLILPNNEAMIELFVFDPSATKQKAILFGRDNNLLVNLFNQFKALLFDKNLKTEYTLDETEITNALKENLKNIEVSAQNAKLKPELNGTDLKFSVSDENVGVAIDYQEGINNLKKGLDSLNSSPIKLRTLTAYPEIYKKDCQNVEAEALKTLDKAPLILKKEEKEWKLDRAKLADWLALEKDAQAKIIIGINQETAIDFIQTKIAPEINNEPKESRFQISNGKVSEFQAGQDGYAVNSEKTIENIKNNWLSGATTTVEIAGDIVKTESALVSENNLGITEIIGTGQSNFSGSPTNRRGNIRNGAKAVSGLIVKPGEEFSLVNALGTVDGASGYLPELVIKGNKTIPEYGGGLCQVATTLFRSAIASGLPITERRNHSYRVSYYEPAGTDAAVYLPKPDVRFLNDTGNNILIQSRIEGDNLYFDFWGTKDGRTTSSSKPVIYNIVRPAAKKIIETTDLKPGAVKCTERAHNGADAYFNYTVNYPNGETKEKRFTSHYVPWQEVCLVGVEQLSASSTPATASSTPSTTATPDPAPTPTSTTTPSTISN